MKDKKLTIYISTYDDIKNPYYGGGGAIAVHEVARGLSKQYKVHVLSWNFGSKKSEIIDKVQYERFGFSFLNPKVAMFFYQMLLPFVAISKHYDVWFESFCPPFTTSFIPLFTKKPVIGIVHMLAAEDMERKYHLPFHLIQNIGLKSYKQIIATSEPLKKKIQLISTNSKITVIGNGIEKVYNPVFNKKKYLLFLGRIEFDQKGIDLLIDAFIQFNALYKEYKLIIAGNGNDNDIEQTKQYIKKNNLENYVELAGRVSGKAKEKLLKEAACLLISSRFETYSLVALEAMALGTPVVSFALEGLSWIPDGASEKVKPYNTKGFANAAGVVVTDTKKSKSMITKGQLYAKECTWDKIAGEYINYLQQV